MKKLKHFHRKAQFFCLLTLLFVAYDWFSLLLFKLTPDQAADFAQKGQVMAIFFFLANIWLDYLKLKLDEAKRLEDIKSLYAKEEP